MSAITAIGFDADDTLWQNETFFRMTEQRFTELLSEHGEHHIISAKLLEAERRNLRFYGYGVKGFTLSMIETAVEVTNGQVAADVIAEILSFGRQMLQNPVETLPHVHETLDALAGRYKILLITKGDLFDQERKLAASTYLVMHPLDRGRFFHQRVVDRRQRHRQLTALLQYARLTADTDRPRASIARHDGWLSLLRRNAKRSHGRPRYSAAADLRTSQRRDGRHVALGRHQHQSLGIPRNAGLRIRIFARMVLASCAR